METKRTPIMRLCILIYDEKLFKKKCFNANSEQNCFHYQSLKLARSVSDQISTCLPVQTVQLNNTS